MLKLEDLFKLQQLKFYFKFNEGSLAMAVYLQNWDITTKLINDTPERVKDKINTHSLQSFINYGKNDTIHKYGNA